MRVLLVNIDSRYPNLALHRLAIHHKNDNVTWKHFTRQRRVREYTPAVINRILGPVDKLVENYDIVYVSCVFTHNKPLADRFVQYKNCYIGGTGFNYLVRLPSNIESIRPHIGMDFTTRGCFRRCPFCLVWRSEGDIKIVGDLFDVWDGKSGYVALLDNNILAVPEHFKRICYLAIKYGVALDFTQGLDIRLITPEVCEWLRKVRLYKNLKFAYDDPALSDIVHEKVALLRRYLRNYPLFFYVLVGFNTTFDQDKARIDELRQLGCRPYVMRYHTVYFDPFYMAFADWVNCGWAMRSMTFDQFLQYLKNRPKRETHKRKRGSTNLQRKMLSQSYPFGYEVVQ